MNELLGLLEYIEQERGIGRQELVDALEKSLVSAGRKSITHGKDLGVQVNGKSGEIKAWVVYAVVDGPSTDESINIEDARKIKPDVEVGDTVNKIIPPAEFGRIAAQTARQTMMQQLRKAEKAKVFDDFKDSVGKIVSGIVRRFESGSAIVDFQKAEGVLSYKDKIPGENYSIGDRVNAVLVKVDSTGSGPSLILSRTSRKFIGQLFEQEVAEISDGTVEIKAIARDPGVRSKIAVCSHDPRVDPIGACVGMRGSRVKSITTELGGERIDIVKHDDDLSTYVANAMQPATLKTVELDEEKNIVNVYVDQGQVRLAIGKNWQNIKLCGQLLGIKINVFTLGEEKESFEEKIGHTVSDLAEKLKIDKNLAEILVKSGFPTVEGLKAADENDILAIDVLNEEEVQGVFDALKSLG